MLQKYCRDNKGNTRHTHQVKGRWQTTQIFEGRLVFATALLALLPFLDSTLMNRTALLARPTGFTLHQRWKPDRKSISRSTAVQVCAGKSPSSTAACTLHALIGLPTACNQSVDLFTSGPQRIAHMTENRLGALFLQVHGAANHGIVPVSSCLHVI